jgi:hypothetical protein
MLGHPDDPPEGQEEPKQSKPSSKRDAGISAAPSDEAV